MDRKLYERIDRWMEAHRDAIIQDICRLVRIPSVSEPGGADAPFGQGCRDALEEMLRLGAEYGFHTHNYENHVGALWLEDGPMDNTIGFWNHLDVVPAGGNWAYPPFEPVVKQSWLIGRGAQDNKGPAVGMLYVMRCLKELGVPLKHRLCLFVGCDEERGMEDLEYYTAHYETPALSMIADSGFPVCYGEKGIIEGNMTAKRPLSSDVEDIRGGTVSNMIPDLAQATLRGETARRAMKVLGSEETSPHAACAEETDGVQIRTNGGGSVTVTVRGTARHSAFPEGSVNAIQKLLALLAEKGVWSDADEAVLRGFQEANSDYYGEALGIAFEDAVSGKLTCAGTVASMNEGILTLHFNIRYSITETQEHILEGLQAFCETHQCAFQLLRGSGPSYFNRSHPAVDLLTSLYNAVMGTEAEPFVMGGGTYARKLPNAFAYGIGGMPKTEEQKECTLFAPQHGDAHQPDEGLYLPSFMKALKIYALAVTELNQLERL